MDFYEVVNNNGYCIFIRRKILFLRKRKYFDEKIKFLLCISMRYFGRDVGEGV